MWRKRLTCKRHKSDCLGADLITVSAPMPRVAKPVNLLIRINLHERVPHPAFFWRGGKNSLLEMLESSNFPAFQ